MGVLTMEIEKMNKTIIENQKEVERLTKQSEKAKEEKKTQKEYERDLKIAVENDCINCMKRDFEKEGYTNACINLQLAKTRQDIIENVAESEIERQYLDNNYERIFNKIKRIYENDEKSKKRYLKLETQKQLEEIQKQEEKKQEHNSIIIAIFAFIFILVMSIIAINNFWLFMIICVVGTIVFSIINAIVVSIKK